MINLIRNELIKISKKKSTYIILLVTLVFVIIANVIYKIDWDDNFSYDVESEIEFYEEQLRELEQLKDSDIDDINYKETYINCKTELEVTKLIQKYGDYSTWQSQIICERGYTYIENMVRYKYTELNEQEYAKAEQEYNEFVAKLDLGDWQYFVKSDLKDTETELEELIDYKKQTTNKQELAEIEAHMENLELQKQILNWRLDKNICYGDGYYDQCINSYLNCKNEIRTYENTDFSNYSDKEKYQEKQYYYASLENAAISQYDIEHKTHVGDLTTAKGVLLNIFSEFEIFIIIMVVMVAGTIVSEEFNKGTIKLLLIKPYKRVKILTAKFITALIMLAIAIIAVMLMQFVVGGIVQGFDSFSEPTMVYNYTTNQLEEINTAKYLAMETLGKLPIYILLLTLAFALSTLFNNSALAIAITLLGSMSASTINMLAQAYNLTWIKFFVTPNWDLTQYFFGNLPDFEGLTMGFSIGIILIYMVIMLVPTYIVFKKRNIKNI